MFIMLILCKIREQAAILDELEDWKDEGAQVFMSGVTSKTNQGFIFVEWGKPIPENFHQKMKQDGDIIDYIAFGKDVTTASITQSA